MAYAETTTVAVEKSIAEIVTLVKRAGAERVAQAEEPNSFAIQFFLEGRMIRFRVKLPGIETIPDRKGTGPYRDGVKRRELLAGVHRQRARALLLVVKAKLESVESEVETFEEAFLANIVMSDGSTVYERISAPIAVEYERGTPQMLLEGPR
jgi:hypothetical protein